MSKNKGPNKENLEKTRQVFLEVAEKEFVEQGYSNASTTRIVENSGMARGSLYYHFGDKYGLFKAVYQDIVEKKFKKISRKMDAANDASQAFFLGCDLFLDLCMDESFRKIALIESQIALSLQERLLIQEAAFLGKLRSILPELLKLGFFPGHTEKTAIIFTMGILAETGRSFDFSSDIERDRQECGKALKATLEALSA